MTQFDFRKGHIEKLEFAIRLCQLDWKNQREGDLLNLREELGGFLSKGAFHLKELAPKHLTDGMIASVQAGLIRMLERIVEEASQTSSTLENIFKPRVEIQLVGKLILSVSPNAPFNQIILHDRMEDRIYCSFISHLVASGIVSSQIMVCSTCQRYFLARKKPRAEQKHHCSLRCAQLTATRVYRRKPKVKKRERKRSSQRYDARHPKAKVRKRPRLPQ